MKQAEKKGSKVPSLAIRHRGEESVSMSAAALVMTPNVFRRLDLIARKNGYVVKVVAAEEMGSDWGRVNCFADTVYADITVPRLCYFETRSIEMASRISADDFHHARRPEIDLSAIPRSSIWDYVVWHEIGHLHDNFSIVETQFDQGLRDSADWQEWIRAHRIIMEVLADRYAWTAIGGGRPLPVSQTRTVSADYISEWIAKLDARYKRRPGRNCSLPTEAFKCVPASHMKAGVPFEKPEHRQAALDELISYRRRALPALIKKAEQAGVIVEYLHGNRGEVPAPKLGWRSDMDARVLTMHDLQSELTLLGGYAKTTIAKTLPRVRPAWLIQADEEREAEVRRLSADTVTNQVAA